jgi:hypothetical protein
MLEGLPFKEYLNINRGTICTIESNETKVKSSNKELSQHLFTNGIDSFPNVHRRRFFPFSLRDEE